jgi:HD superfamily phosphohydrolase YqeK
MDIESHDLYGEVTEEDAVERLPELTDIKDDHVRAATTGVVQEFPDYWWTAPASSRHHPPEHRQRHGLWIHTQRVCTAFERLAESMVKQGHLEWQDIDYGRAACILHDMFKYGMPPTSVDGTVDDHDVLAANWLDEHTQLPDEVIGAVEAHNGAWYQGKTPESHLEQIVHIADMHASDENCRIAVKEPHDILREQFPRVSER